MGFASEHHQSQEGERRALVLPLSSGILGSCPGSLFPHLYKGNDTYFLCLVALQDSRERRHATVIIYLFIHFCCLPHCLASFPNHFKILPLQKALPEALLYVSWPCIRPQSVGDCFTVTCEPGGLQSLGSPRVRDDSLVL